MGSKPELITLKLIHPAKEIRALGDAIALAEQKDAWGKGGRLRVGVRSRGVRGGMV